MKKYIILAETGADVHPDIAKKYGIYIVPMHVSFGEVTKDDGSFPIEELFSYFDKSGSLPKTSGCNITDFEKIFEQIREEHPESHILYLAYSAVTTCSYQSCLIASEEMTNITHFDTKQVSGGQGLIVEMVARYLEKNPDVDLETITEFINDLIARSHMAFFPGGLEYLRAGGRVSNAAYIGAKILSLNPLIEMIDGKLIATKKYRGSMAKTSKKMLVDFVEKENLDRSIVFMAYSAGLSETLKQELTQITKDLGFQEIRWLETGSVVSTHAGPGAFGLTGFTKK